MENENMMNEEVIEMTEGIVKASGFGKFVKFGVGAVVVTGVSVVTYKYAVKPLMKKIKNRKTAKITSIDELENGPVEFFSDEAVTE